MIYTLADFMGVVGWAIVTHVAAFCAGAFFWPWLWKTLTKKQAKL